MYIPQNHLKNFSWLIIFYLKKKNPDSWTEYIQVLRNVHVSKKWKGCISNWIKVYNRWVKVLKQNVNLPAQSLKRRFCLVSDGVTVGPFVEGQHAFQTVAKADSPLTFTVRPPVLECQDSGVAAGHAAASPVISLSPCKWG